MSRPPRVCGLYLDPPENAIVVSIDEKTGIQAKEPARPYTQAAPGHPPRRDNKYVRHGTQNLFAAHKVHFSILARRLLKHATFDSETDLAAQTLAFVERYNLTAKPFKWTYTGKMLVA